MNAKYDPNYRCQAIMLVDEQFIESLLPKGKTLESFGEFDGVPRQDATWVERMLMLPSNAKITGVSTQAFLSRNQIAFRVRCPDFVETAEGNELPTIGVIHLKLPDGSARFAHWEGAALTDEYRKWLDQAQAKFLSSIRHDTSSDLWEKAARKAFDEAVDAIGKAVEDDAVLPLPRGGYF